MPSRSRFVLLPQSGSQPPPADAPRLRRYRLARLSINGRRPTGADRHEHLKRVFD